MMSSFMMSSQHIAIPLVALTGGRKSDCRKEKSEKPFPQRQKGLLVSKRNKMFGFSMEIMDLKFFLVSIGPKP